METYLEFLKSKIVLAQKTGFDVAPGKLHGTQGTMSNVAMVPKDECGMVSGG